MQGQPTALGPVVWLLSFAKPVFNWFAMRKTLTNLDDHNKKAEAT
jgi:hypothetical protein